ncbi:MAG: hypothetical protein Q9M14_08835 [Mariprofundaceae bacterium]|nr:hypothetical protein [Mariprofundaceae bacterium]
MDTNEVKGEVQTKGYFCVVRVFRGGKGLMFICLKMCLGLVLL